MIKVKKEYQKAYELYLKKLEDRPHKYGKTKCLVCDDEFDKTSGKHLYCSRQCRLIRAIYVRLSQRKWLLYLDEMVKLKQ